MDDNRSEPKRNVNVPPGEVLAHERRGFYTERPGENGTTHAYKPMLHATKKKRIPLLDDVDVGTLPESPQLTFLCRQRIASTTIRRAPCVLTGDCCVVKVKTGASTTQYYRRDYNERTRGRNSAMFWGFETVQITYSRDSFRVFSLACASDVNAIISVNLANIVQIWPGSGNPTNVGIVNFWALSVESLQRNTLPVQIGIGIGNR